MFYFIEKTPLAKVLTRNCSNTEKSLHFGDSVFSLCTWRFQHPATFFWYILLQPNATIFTSFKQVL